MIKRVKLYFIQDLDIFLIQVCALICLYRLLDCVNLLLHESHSYFFSPVCTGRCCFNVDRCWKSLWQKGQTVLEFWCAQNSWKRYELSYWPLTRCNKNIKIWKTIFLFCIWIHSTLFFVPQSVARNTERSVTISTRKGLLACMR